MAETFTTSQLEDIGLAIDNMLVDLREGKKQGEREAETLLESLTEVSRKLEKVLARDAAAADCWCLVPETELGQK